MNCESMSFNDGDRVRVISGGRLGAWLSFPPDNPGKFQTTIEPGTIGTVALATGLPDGWVLVRFSGDVVAPVRPGMLEALRCHGDGSPPS